MSEETADQHQPKTTQRGSRQKTILFWAALVSICVLMIVFLGYIMNKPSKGKILQTKPEAVISPDTNDGSWKVQKGRFVQFAYPYGYELQVNEQHPAGKDFDSFYFMKNMTTGYEHLAVTATKDATAITEVSGFQIRKDSSKYVLATTELAGSTVYIFTSDDSQYERTAFVSHGGIVVTISLSANNGHNQQNSQRFNSILAGWKFL